MAGSAENPVGAIALDSRLVEETGYSQDDFTAAKPIFRKRKRIRKGRHGESTE